MSFSIHHTPSPVGQQPTWYHLEFARTLDKAIRRARSYELGNGGYCCVKDVSGRIVATGAFSEASPARERAMATA